MEFSGFLKHFSDLPDATKYAGIDHFLGFNQPPTNCTFRRAAAHPNFALHTGAAWEALELTPDGQQVRARARARLSSACAAACAAQAARPRLRCAALRLAPGGRNARGSRHKAPPMQAGWPALVHLLTSFFPSCLHPPAQVRLTSSRGEEGCFDFLIVSTGLLTDARLRPELAGLAEHIATWGDAYNPEAHGQKRNPLIDAHPYLVGGRAGGGLRGGAGGGGEGAGPRGGGSGCMSIAPICWRAPAAALLRPSCT